MTRGVDFLLAAAAVFLASCAAVPPERPALEVHGMSDAFAAPGVALAWGILQGADEASTVVVMRIAADRSVYPWFAVVGVDPFTKEKREVLAPTRSAEVNDIRAPRSHYADFPRTEVRLYESESAARRDKPALVVFFLGVPDTTPELATEEKLQAYFNERLARLPRPSR